MVKKKKPSPDIYLLAKDTMGLDPTRTVVIEDSEIGLAAAKAAGMKCVVTKSSYTKEEVRVFRGGGDGPSYAKPANPADKLINVTTSTWGHTMAMIGLCQG